MADRILIASRAALAWALAAGRTPCVERRSECTGIDASGLRDALRQRPAGRDLRRRRAQAPAGSGASALKPSCRDRSSRRRLLPRRRCRRRPPRRGRGSTWRGAMPCARRRRDRPRLERRPEPRSERRRAEARPRREPGPTPCRPRVLRRAAPPPSACRPCAHHRAQGNAAARGRGLRHRRLHHAGAVARCRALQVGVRSLQGDADVAIRPAARHPALRADDHLLADPTRTRRRRSAPTARTWSRTTPSVSASRRSPTPTRRRKGWPAAAARS